MAGSMSDHMVGYVRSQAAIGNEHTRSSDFIANAAALMEEVLVGVGMDPREANAKAEAIMSEHFLTSELAVQLDKQMQATVDLLLKTAREVHEIEAKRAKVIQKMDV